MSSIGIVGNCQAGVIAEMLKIMLPGHDIRHSGNRDLLSGNLNADYVFSADVVFVGDMMRRKIDPLVQALPFAPILHTFPEVYFTGFHPDIIYAIHGKEQVRSPLGSNNSALCLWGWLQGWDAEKIIGLFNFNTFKRLGYFDHYDQSRSALITAASASGLDLSDEFRLWESSGIFMHCANHPKPLVLAGLARQIVSSLGLKAVVSFPEMHVPDTLCRIVWPVYEEIADRLGVYSEYIFSISGKILTLPQFVSASLALYDANYEQSKVISSRFKSGIYANIDQTSVVTPREQTPAYPQLKPTNLTEEILEGRRIVCDEELIDNV